MVSLSMVFHGPPKLEDEEMFIRIGDEKARLLQGVWVRKFLGIRLEH